MKHKKMIFDKKVSYILDGKWAHKVENIEVILLCSSGKWAMVRRKGLMPFVVGLKDLRPIG